MLLDPIRLSAPEAGLSSIELPEDDVRSSQTAESLEPCNGGAQRSEVVCSQ
jgi:hypothetical protein